MVEKLLVNKNQRVIIGLSPGRTGSKSIAHILAKQKSSSSNHEHGPKLPFEKDIGLFNKNVSSFLEKYKDSKYVCFNGFFYTWYTDELLSLFPKAKVYVLFRDFEDTVKSHYKKVIKRTEGKFKYKNYWNNYDRSRCKSDWEICFPKFNHMLLLRESIVEYIKFYWELIDKLVQSYPNNIKIFDINMLNTRGNLINFLRYVGIDDNDIMLPKQRVQVVHRWFEINEKRGGVSVEFEGLK